MCVYHHTQYLSLNLYGPPPLLALGGQWATIMSTTEKRGTFKRKRRNPPTPPHPPLPPPSSSRQPKMDLFHNPASHDHSVDNCCDSSNECCDLSVLECSDEQCSKFIDDYCQLCLDQQACMDAGCSFAECSLECTECCDDTSCAEGHSSASLTQVPTLILSVLTSRQVVRLY